MRTKLDKILNNDLCLGCGLCESIGKKHGYVMELGSNGFYLPKLPKNRDTGVENAISKVCPGININGDGAKTVWGKIDSLRYLWSSDEEIRFKGSSGGAITSIALYLLSTNKVDAVLHVGKSNNHYLSNNLMISRSKTEIVNNASSRYAPALVLNELEQILNVSNDTYCFIGKPCDIQAVKNYLQLFPQHINKIKYYISFFCAGIPSYNATKSLIAEANNKSDPVSVKYRGDGWPGKFRVTFADKTEYTVPYTRSWGEVLGRKVHFRCKVCPDAIGLQADIVLGDAWEAKSGYPDFEEKPGRSFAIARNHMGTALLEEMILNKAIVDEQMALEKLEITQPYQFQRRLFVGYRLLPLYLITGFIFKFNNLRLCWLMKKMHPIDGLRETYGTLKRYSKRNEN